MEISIYSRKPIIEKGHLGNFFFKSNYALCITVSVVSSLVMGNLEELVSAPPPSCTKAFT